ncbi:hypothetical protein BIW11_14251, partial [Tropilaelaps mercedesae]
SLTHSCVLVLETVLSASPVYLTSADSAKNQFKSTEETTMHTLIVLSAVVVAVSAGGLGGYGLGGDLALHNGHASSFAVGQGAIAAPVLSVAKAAPVFAPVPVQVGAIQSSSYSTKINHGTIVGKAAIAAPVAVAAPVASKVALAAPAIAAGAGFGYGAGLGYDKAY